MPGVCGPLQAPCLPPLVGALVSCRGQHKGQSQTCVTCPEAAPREVIIDASSCSLIPRWLVPILQILISEPCWRQNLLLITHLLPPLLSSSSHPCHHPPFNTCLPVCIPILRCRGRGQNFSEPARSVWQRNLYLKYTKLKT